MIDRAALLTDLQKLLRRLETDLLERSESSEVPQVGQTLRGEYQRAFAAQRTAQNYTDWRSDAITQAAAAWVLGGVFVRFLEDNGLIEPPRLAGPGDRLARARDEHELYFRANPRHSDRDYLWSIFESLAGLPGTRDVFGAHNPLRELPNWLSGDAAGELLRFFQKIDVETGRLVHDFTDPEWDTRFLGDLYQDLSEAARKKYALLQTPDFVEEFILDRTLNPALDEFGLDAPAVLDRDGKPVTPPGFRMIDPACGSGHFLLGAFPRLLDRWQRREPATNIRELVQRTLDSVCGVDVNPYAVAIARFRLLLAAMRVCGIRRLADAPGFRLNLACGDSLLHAPLKSGQQVLDFEKTSGDIDCDHAYQSEDLPTLKRLLRGGQYHAVVANPPYIVPRDAQLNERYRKRFKSCHRQYSLAVPFFERIFGLAVQGGYTGQITANSFMKREFGKRLIESYLPNINLTHVIDSSGAYIPGHGTPTVILFGSNTTPVQTTVRAVFGIRGEPSTPTIPSQGVVWQSIVKHTDRVGMQDAYTSTTDVSRNTFTRHPWSIGGGGASELKEIVEASCTKKLQDLISDLGRSTHSGEDSVFYIEPCAARTRTLTACTVPLIEGEGVRDYQLDYSLVSLFPYNQANGEPVEMENDSWIKHIWQYRTPLKARRDFGQTIEQRGLRWFDHSMFFANRYRHSLSIAFAFVASHNHFVLDRGGKVFKQSAPVIKLPAEATEDDHLALLGLLNSSAACFWMKQVSHQKQMMGGDGVRVDSKAKVPYEFAATQLEKLPLPHDWANPELMGILLDLSTRIEKFANRGSRLTAINAIREDSHSRTTIERNWEQLQTERLSIRSQMIFLQEEIDFTVYVMWSLADRSLLCSPDLWKNAMIDAGVRPFEILCGRSEDDFPVPSAIPAEWPDKLRDVWQRRIDAIKNSPELRVIEDSHYKRRWIGRQGLFNHTKNTDELREACTSWLLDRLESYFDFDGRMNDRGEPTAKLEVGVVSVARLADVARQDAEFQEVGALYRNDTAFDVEALVAELVAAESVPLLPVLRYKPSGLVKRQAWEETWARQRQEDAIDARTQLPTSDPRHLSEAAARAAKESEVGAIAVPPKYDSKDFASGDFWRLRGKLDVPKERWISLPHCEGADGTLAILWAGYDHLQQAQAISAWFVEIQERLGGRDDPRLIPLLATLLELLPWLKQWHNDIDPEFGMAMGDYFEGFVAEEARQLGKTLPEIAAWIPPKKAPRASRTKNTDKPPAKRRAKQPPAEPETE